MSSPVTIILLNAAISLLLGGGLITWLRFGPERRKTRAETDNILLKDLKEAYLRVCDDLAQSQMRLAACEEEAEGCRRRMTELHQETQIAITNLTVEVGRQARLSILARARAHVAGKMLLNYELHNDTVLDEIRHHNKACPDYQLLITPMMRTQRLREAYRAQMEKLEEMEAPELEILLKQTPESEIGGPPI